ncbi:MAG TPA: hypothetical protein VI336_03900 [Candidatus Saccharimonadales bacterium]|nr:hypothetical protein [Candidatus Saccharimonadales bacterium]
MVSPEKSPDMISSLIPQVIEVFLESEPVYSHPVDVVDGEVKESRYEPLGVPEAVVDVTVALGLDPRHNLEMKGQLVAAAEKQIENLEQIMERRQELADRLNDSLAA